MVYELDIIPLLKQYKGKTLASISGKADITIMEVNNEEILMVCSDGQEFREVHKRTKTAFEQLQKNKCIHVDAAVKNSGTRRNIPETLLANLPFVEHDKIDGRKHLFLNQGQEAAHELGTLRARAR